MSSTCCTNFRVELCLLLNAILTFTFSMHTVLELCTFVLQFNSIFSALRIICYAFYCASVIDSASWEGHHSLLFGFPLTNKLLFIFKIFLVTFDSLFMLSYCTGLVCCMCSRLVPHVLCCIMITSHINFLIHRVCLWLVSVWMPSHTGNSNIISNSLLPSCSVIN